MISFVCLVSNMFNMRQHSYIQIVTLEPRSLSAGLSVLYRMIEAPDVCESQTSEFSKNNCARLLRVCNKLHFDVSASHIWLTGSNWLLLK